jgi:putative addiction module CopG family antidote
MNVELKTKWKKFVESRVATKQYPNAEAVVEEALKLMREEERKRDELRGEIQLGVDQINRGEYIEISDTKTFAKEFITKMHARHAAKQRKSA